MKLETKHLAAYLPYKLNCLITDNEKEVIDEMFAVYDDGTACFANVIESSQGFESIKPILRPLIDMNKELFINGMFGFIPAKRIANEYLNTSYWGANEIGTGVLDKDNKMVNLCFIGNEIVGECPFLIYQSLCEWHFDIFGLIEKGLAVDINKLSVE